MNLVFEWDWLNADQLTEHIAKLEKMKADQETIDGCIAGMYASRCKKPKDELLELMKEGAWLTAEQALDWGFVDEITDRAEDIKPELTDSVASILADAGIPMPPIPVKKDSFVAKLTQFFSSMFASEPKPADAVTDTKAETAASAQPSTTHIMDKFKQLLALLGGAAIAMSADKTFPFTEEQLKTVDDRLAQNDSEITNLKAQVTDKDSKISQLEAKIKELDRQPAATTDTVTVPANGDAEGGPIDDIKAMSESLLNLFK